MRIFITCPTLVGQYVYLSLGRTGGWGGFLFKGGSSNAICNLTGAVFLTPWYMSIALLFIYSS